MWFINKINLILGLILNMSNYIWTLTICLVSSNASHRDKDKLERKNIKETKVPPDADSVEAVEKLFNKFKKEETNYNHVLWIQLSLHKDSISTTEPYNSFSYQFKNSNKKWNQQPIEEAKDIFKKRLIESGVVNFAGNINPD